MGENILSYLGQTACSGGAVSHYPAVLLQAAIFNFASVLIVGCITSIFTSVFPVVLE